MPQPQTPHYPRHGSISLATWYRKTQDITGGTLDVLAHDTEQTLKHRTTNLQDQAPPEWGEKAETQNLGLWDDRLFPECPVQLRTPTNQVPPGTVWTADVPQAWLGEPNIPDEQRVTTAIDLKLRLGQ